MGISRIVYAAVTSAPPLCSCCPLHVTQRPGGSHVVPLAVVSPLGIGATIGCTSMELPKKYSLGTLKLLSSFGES